MNARRRRYKTIARTFVAAAMAAALGGCSTLGYYAHLAAGEMSVLRARRPIPQVIADPQTPPALRARLELAVRARAFASDRLKLPHNRSYTTYADIHRPFVMWNVFATPALSLKPVEHCFLFAGCVAYQGFYHKDRAEALAAKLQRQGDDVWVGGVPAYSTLGHFADPLLSTMDDWSDDETVGTIFHELAHQEYYVPDDTAFNESFATFVQREGLRRWHADNHLPPPDPTVAQHQKQFTALVLATRKRLEALYASDLPDAAKLRRKRRVFDDMRRQYVHLRDSEWQGSHDYEHWFATPINNAKLLPFGLYDRGVPAFAELFEQCGRDWIRFYAAVRKLGSEPAKQRDAFLAGANPAAPPATPDPGQDAGLARGACLAPLPSAGTRMNEAAEIPTYQAYPFDARAIAHRFRHSAIFGALDALEVGEAMRFVNDHDPIPLLAQMRQRYGERIDVIYQQRGGDGPVVIDFVVTN